MLVKELLVFSETYSNFGPSLQKGAMGLLDDSIRFSRD